MVNDKICGSIRLPRGIRQGDPLSPYLFILCIGVLSQRLQIATTNKLGIGIELHPTAEKISCHLFVDDNLLFVNPILLRA